VVELWCGVAPIVAAASAVGYVVRKFDKHRILWRKPGAKSLGGWWVGNEAFFKDKKGAVAFAAKQRGLTTEMLRKPVAPRDLCARL